VGGIFSWLSGAFALANALKVTSHDVVIFAILCGLAVMMIDRMFAATMYRQRDTNFTLVSGIAGRRPLRA
jgi:hypothetical protein